MPQNKNTEAAPVAKTVILQDAKVYSVGVLEEGKSTVKVDIENTLQPGSPAIRGYVSVKSAAEDKFLTALEDAAINKGTITVSINEATFDDPETGATVALIYINPYTLSVVDQTADELAKARAARAARFATPAATGKKEDSEAVKKAIAEADAKLKVSK